MYGLPNKTACCTVGDVKTSDALATPINVKLLLVDLAGVLLVRHRNDSGKEPATSACTQDALACSSSCQQQRSTFGPRQIADAATLQKICVYGCPVDAPVREVVVSRLGSQRRPCCSLNIRA